MLSRQPKYLLPALIVVLVLVGLLTIPPIGAAALVIVGLFVGWLAFLSWPLLQPTQRTLRLVILALLFAAAAARAAGAL